MMQYANLIPKLRLARSKNVGSKTFQNLIAACGNAKVALNAWEKICQRAGKKTAICSEFEAEEEIEQTMKMGGEMIAFDDCQYPKQLLQIDDFPPIISIKGDRNLLKEVKNLAIVGGRNASASSCLFASKIAEEMSAHSYVVTSGLARGIDKSAHLGALKFGKTIAVIATGIDQIYPSENSKLFSEISEKGLIITENKFNSQLRSGNFPRRNRIISALSVGVLVVEASLKSGSLITANYAVSHNRPVFSIPSFPLDERSKGGNALIKTGVANLVESAEDILDLIATKNMLNDGASCFSDANVIDFSNFSTADFIFDEKEIDSSKSEIYDFLNSSPIAIDDLCNLMELNLRYLLLAIIELEMENKIERLPNNKIIRKYSE